jgi:hypothetical protein
MTPCSSDGCDATEQEKNEKKLSEEIKSCLLLSFADENDACQKLAEKAKSFH